MYFIIEMPQGVKPKGSKILNLAEAKQTKNSIVRIKNMPRKKIYQLQQYLTRCFQKMKSY